jgi:uncharacterized Fe-S cluster protein YjdI
MDLLNTVKSAIGGGPVEKSNDLISTIPNLVVVHPWIKPENATTEELINQVAKCPLSALRIKQV